MEVGQDATILANALVDLDATATTQAGVGSGSGTTKQVPALSWWSALTSTWATTTSAASVPMARSRPWAR